MKVFKNKKLSLIIATLFILIVVALIFTKDNILVSSKTVKILNYGYSNCTMDVPSSSCGPYEVKVQSIDGDKFTYKVDGFDNRKSERYYYITHRIRKAKENNATVLLKTNDEGYIIAVE